MARLLNGFTGPITGKMGNMVYYVVNGKQMVRTVRKVNKPPTEKQLHSYAQMGVINKFLKPIIEFVNAGFTIKANGTTKTPYNLALGYNKKYALQGEYPDPISINYEKVLLTQGKMHDAINPAVALTTEGLTFTWECPRSIGWPRPTDQVMLLAYFPELQQAIYVLAGASRIRLTEMLKLKPELLSEHMEIYISFVAENRKAISDSTYLGAINI